jgi:hypothetical protein
MIDFHAAQVRGHRRNMNAIAGFLRLILPISSGSICTNGLRMNTLS